MCCYGGDTFHFPETVRNRGQGRERGQSGPGLGKGRNQKSTNCQVQLVAQLVKNPPVMWETWVQSLGQEDPLEKGMATHSRFLAGESHGQRSLVSYSLWGQKESDTTD